MLRSKYVEAQIYASVSLQAASKALPAAIEAL